MNELPMHDRQHLIRSWYALHLEYRHLSEDRFQWARKRMIDKAREFNLELPVIEYPNKVGYGGISTNYRTEPTVAEVIAYLKMFPDNYLVNGHGHESEGAMWVQVRPPNDD